LCYYVASDEEDEDEARRLGFDGHRLSPVDRFCIRYGVHYDPSPQIPIRLASDRLDRRCPLRVAYAGVAKESVQLVALPQHPFLVVLACITVRGDDTRDRKSRNSSRNFFQFIDLGVNFIAQLATSGDGEGSTRSRCLTILLRAFLSPSKVG